MKTHHLSVVMVESLIVMVHFSVCRLVREHFFLKLVKATFAGNFHYTDKIELISCPVLHRMNPLYRRRSVSPLR